MTALFWWHPLVWWVRHSLRDAEEQCCDAWVVWAFPDAAQSYAETLLETLDFLNRSPSRAAAGQRTRQGSSSAKEVDHDHDGYDIRVLGVRGTLGLLALAGVLLPVGATWAQKAEEPKESRFVVRPMRTGRASRGRRRPCELTSQPSMYRRVNSTPDANVVAVRLDGQDKAGADDGGHAGSVDDVIKKLEARDRGVEERRRLVRVGPRSSIEVTDARLAAIKK